MGKNKMVRLGLFREDPNNVSEATAEEIERLAGKLRRVPLGLTAMRIAYVLGTDFQSFHPVRLHSNQMVKCGMSSSQSH